MRDDLYKTVPPTSAWRRVIRYAARESDWFDAQEAMIHAIRVDVLSQVDARRLEALRWTVAHGSPDLWGTSRLPSSIDAYIAQAASEHERRLGYMIHGLLQRDGYRASLVSAAVEEICRESVNSCIEQCCATIRKAGEIRQAAIAKRVLTELSAGLEFNAPKVQKHKALVDTVLDLRI